MKKSLSISFFLLFSIAFSFAFEGEIVYVEGGVRIKDADHNWRPADFGEPVVTEDTIVTEDDGFVEIETASSTITIEPDTIFSLMDAESGGSRQDALTCISGAVAFKIGKLTGNPPVINTLVANAGVRGTEFTLFAAADGTSLVSVSEGVVEVSAAGESVTLLAEEGVEVSPGEAPGEKFPVLRGELDFSGWNEKRMETFLADPVSAVYRLYSRLEAYSAEIEALSELYDVNKELLQAQRLRLEEVKEKEGAAAAADFYKETILPLEIETSNQRLNIRYYALSALSLRRYLLGRLYLQMKTIYFAKSSRQLYRDYLSAHNQALTLFEKKIVPFLVDADI